MSWAERDVLERRGVKAEPGVREDRGQMCRRRRFVIAGEDGSAKAESREAEDVAEAINARTRWASSGFEDLKLGSLTSGISGERSESAACRG